MSSAPRAAAGARWPERKLCLVVDDALRTDKLHETIAAGEAPAFAALLEGRRRTRAHRKVRRALREPDGVDLLARCDGTEAVVERDGSELRFAPGSGVVDRRGRGWDFEGDPAALSAEVRDGVFDSELYPDALGRLWAALRSPSSGDVLISCAGGYEVVDWGGVTTHRAAATGHCSRATPSARSRWSVSSRGWRRGTRGGG